MILTNYRNTDTTKEIMENYPFTRSSEEKDKHRYVIVQDGEDLNYVRENKKKYVQSVNGLGRGSDEAITDGRKNSYNGAPFFDLNLVQGVFWWLTQPQYSKINGLGMLAMYANESDWGRSRHCWDNNNLFNIKNSQWSKIGNFIYSYNMPDPVEKSDPFYYAYGDINDSIEAYCQVISTRTKYSDYGDYYYDYIHGYMNSELGKQKAIDYWMYIKEAGYSTASADYKGIVESVIKRIEFLLKK